MTIYDPPTSLIFFPSWLIPLVVAFAALMMVAVARRFTGSWLIAFFIAALVPGAAWCGRLLEWPWFGLSLCLAFVFSLFAVHMQQAAENDE